jgi:hypothetical protein
MTRTKFIIIFLLLIATVVLGSLAISVTLISLFQNLSPVQIWLFWITPAALTICFVFAQIASAKFFNIITRVVYTITAAWMGFYVYFLCASVLYGITHIQTLGSLFLSLALSSVSTAFGMPSRLK